MTAGAGRWRFKKGTWGAEEDALLLAFVEEHGQGSWNTAHQYFPSLNRTGKSCRLRYLNQLHPKISRSSIKPEEERFILMAHSVLGNQWSRIAGRLPGRTDNFVKNVVNMWIKRARRRRAASMISSTARPAQVRLKCDQQPAVYTPAHAVVTVPPSHQASNHVPLPTSACGLSILPQPPPVGMHGSLGSSDSSLLSYTAPLAASGLAGGFLMNDAAAEACAYMQTDPSPSAGMINDIGLPTFSPMLSTEGKMMGSYYQGSNCIVPGPTGSYNIDWPAMQAPLAVQASLENLSACTGILPSAQNPFQSSLQLPSVQSLFHEKLPSVQNVSTMSSPVPLVQQPLQSLEGSELPTIQSKLFQNLLVPGSEKLPSVQLAVPHQPVMDMASMTNQPIVSNRPIISGDNDLLEAIKLTGLYCGGSSSSAAASCSLSSSSSVPSLLATSSSNRLISHEKEEGDFLFCNMNSTLQQLLATEDFAGELNARSQMLDGLDEELANMVLDSNSTMWISMPGASLVGESAKGKASYC